MGIGETLREARNEKNITLDELQETTKIQKRYLKAIEEGNFDILPGTFYARAFIKEYANAVGLDSEELLTSHEDELPAIGEKQSTTQYTRIQRSQKSSRSSKASAFFSFLPTLIVILLVIGIIAVAIYLYQQSISSDPGNGNEPQDNNEFYRKDDVNNNSNNENNDTDEDNNENDNNDENDENETNNEDTDEALESQLNEVEAGSGSVPESTFEFISDTDEIQLTIHVSDEVWLDVNDKDGQPLHSNLVTADESPLELDVSEEESIFLNIGSAPFVEVYMNDQLLEYPADKNDYVHQQIWIHLKQNEQ